MALSSKPLSSILFFVFTLFTFAHASAIHRRAVINHDAVVSFPQLSPNTSEGAAYLKFKPWLDVPHGCVPFPAVDVMGNTGGGLSQHDGDHKNRCSRSLGQVYARGAWYQNVFGIMYSWYMPKDSPSIGLGHRHDWENIIVWIDSLDPATQQILSVSTSYHGNYKKVARSKISVQDSRVFIKYWNILFLNHHPDVTNRKGGQQPLVAWESLTEAARRALTDTNFEAATVPFKDATLMKNLEKAWSS